MIKAFFNLLLISSAMGLFAAPKFVTKEMLIRRGLTDAQYEALWKMGRNPRIDPSAAREWMYKASRYDNATNYIGIIGRTNNFARLALELEKSNIVVTASLKEEKKRRKEEEKKRKFAEDVALSNADQMNSYYNAYTNSVEEVKELRKKVKGYEKKKEKNNGNGKDKKDV